MFQKMAWRGFRRTGEGVYDMDDLAKQTQRMGDYIAAWKEKYQPPPLWIWIFQRRQYLSLCSDGAA